MKLTRSFRLAVSAVLLAGAVIHAAACGPYAPIIPTPEFFGLSGPHKTMSDYEREENLRLWQSLTSDRIPLADIEEAVYRDSRERYYDYMGYDTGKTDNLFYIYLNNSGDQEIIEFLYDAKTLEESWREMRSPWYYPQDRYSQGDPVDFSFFIEKCRTYGGTRLKDRYALQATRALFASRRYAECVEYADSAFSAIPDGNLMKRMARRYVAGSWSRLGEIERADSVFAMAGDIWSVSGDGNPARYMARLNPDAPQLMEYIRCNAADTVFMRDIALTARRLLRDGRVKDKGDWNYLLAYVSNEYEQDASVAHRYICRAVKQHFSSAEFHDLARAYKMKLDAQSGATGTLLDDLRWIESKTDALSPDAGEWIRRVRNIIYADWIPRLWRKRDYATAVLLCAYADNLNTSERRYIAWDNDMDQWYWQTPSITIDEMRDSERYVNLTDYGSLSFQMMGSLSSAQLAAVYGKMMSRSPLYDFLRRKVRTDSDYYNELIGTLALREENYARAESYLARVSDHYIKTMNISKGGYLSRDPFCMYPSLWTVDSLSYGAEAAYCWKAFERPTGWHRHVQGHSAKLDFARKMCRYRHTMEHGSTADERGMARLMYAVGRKNSFEECWALTQYWRGEWVGIFEPWLQYWDDDDGFYENNYSFLYDYDYDDHQAVEALYDSEVMASLAMLATDEARAKANYLLGNLVTVVRRYGTTSTAAYVKTSCDNWRTWL